MLRRLRLTPLVAAVILAAGCGGSSTSPGASGSSTVRGGGAAPSGGALSPDATSAATGDIPDNQNFLTFLDARLRVSMLYPEGWTIQKTADGLSFKDKNNVVRIAVAPGSRPTPATVAAQLAALKGTGHTMTTGTPNLVSLRSGPAVKVTYTTQSASNPVTGKRVTLLVDRYALWHAGRVAVIDLGTPTGVDNVDAYKRMVGSFKWL